MNTLVGGLPAEFPAALLIVVHVQPYAVSHLPEILSRAGPLPALHPADGTVIRPGHIYVAPPDLHMLVRNGRISLTRGPRENHTRPAIDPLFRSAARSHRERVIGIILSGALYDGSIGLMAVKTRGGTTIVQEPGEAAIDSMPRSAITQSTPDYIVSVREMPGLLTELVMHAPSTRSVDDTMDDEERMEITVANDFMEQIEDRRSEETSVFSCQDCGGILWQGGEGPTLWFRCHVGHAYAPEALLQQKAEEMEAALWSSLRLLKEKATLTRQLATRARESGNLEAAERIEERAILDEQHVSAIQDLLSSIPAPIAETVATAGLSHIHGSDD